MHYLNVLAMIFVCFSRVGMCMNCDGSAPSYQSRNQIVANTDYVKKAARAKPGKHWHEVKDDIPGASYYKIIAVIPAISCSSKAEYWLQECELTTGNGCTVRDTFLDGGQVRYMPFKVNEDEIALFGDQSKDWACLDQVPTVDGVMVPNCVSSSYSSTSKTNLQDCTTVDLPSNWVRAATPGVMTLIDDPYTPVTNLADCFYGMYQRSGNWVPYLTIWNEIEPSNDEERAVFGITKKVNDIPPETYCQCTEVPNPVTLSTGKRHYLSEGLTREQVNENQLFRVYKGVVALCAEKQCNAGERQFCGECDNTKEPNERCQITCANCNDGEYADGKICLPKSTCPSNSYAVESELKLNTLCKCNSGFYINKISNDVKFYENDAAFQAHEGTCKPCTTTLECNYGTNETKYIANGCDSVRNAICVCNKGYEGNSEDTADPPECTPCKSSYYKDEIDQVVASGILNKRLNQECTKCPFATMFTDPGATNESQCECPESQIYNGKLCEQCYFADSNKPYRAIGESVCRDCDARHIFNFDTRSCEKWSDKNMVIEIQCSQTSASWGLSPFYDVISIKSTGSLETLKPTHEYWTRAYANVKATSWRFLDMFAPCPSCSSGQYNIACGGPVRTNDEFGNEEYKIAVKINQTVSLMTLNHQFESNEKYDKICTGGNESPLVEILRQGMCINCKTCNTGQYVHDCGKNKKGICKNCDVCSNTENQILADAKEYLWHPNIDQCNSSATQDCKRQKCDKSKIEKDIGGQKHYKIGIECGLHDVEIWDPTTPRLENVEIRTRIIPGKGKFEQGKHEKYCPTGYYVDADCFKEDEDWNPQCCILCKLHDALQKRSSGYRECPGDEDSDTQKYVERCENGFYETTVSDTETTSICKPCTTCSFS